MSDPTAEPLSRFTPDAGGLDHDALLFAAGRASAPPARPWKVLVGALAVGQVVTLILLWPTPPVESLVAHGPTALVQPAELPPPDPSSWGYLRERTRSADIDFPAPVADDSLAPAEPPLRAFTLPPTLLN